MSKWILALQEIVAEAYVVGGAVRDRVLGRMTTDIDIAVSGDIASVGKQLADSIGGQYVAYDKEGRSVRIVMSAGQGHLDISKMQGQSIEDDCQRRDYTINAMAVPLKHWAAADFVPFIIDPCKGLSDCHAGVVRMVSLANLKEDPLRSWRGIRLAGELKFKMEEETLQGISKSAPQVNQIAGERMREEVKRVFTLADSSKSVDRLISSELLTTLWPEIDAMRGVSQNNYHEFTVWEHSWRAFTNYEQILNELDYIDETNLKAKLRDYIDHAPNVWLFKLAALLHDIAKPETRSVGKGDRVHFYGHEKVGSKKVLELGERIRLSNEEKALLNAFIYRHMYPLQLLRTGKEPSQYIYRYFKRTKPVGVWVILFSLADHLAKREDVPKSDAFEQHRAMAEEYLSHYFFNPDKIHLSPIVSGDDLLAELDIQPGKVLGRLKEYLAEQQARDHIRTREDAIAKAKEWLERQ